MARVRAALFLAAAVLPVAGVPRHSKFRVTESGVIELVENPTLRLNVQGGDVKPGDPLVLWPCSAQRHEVFEIADGMIRLGAHRAMCLNAHGGVQPGTNIVTWPCAQSGQPEEHEEFRMGGDGRIRLAKHPNMCINVKGGLVSRGSELVLWPCGGAIPGGGSKDGAATDVFVMNDGVIEVEGNRSFHFNVVGGKLSNSSNLVLWDCQPAVHEMFEFTYPDRRIKVKARPEMCLNVEGGHGMGHRVVAWPCSAVAERNEQFIYNEADKTIHARGISTLTFNVMGGNAAPGGEIIMWTTDEREEM